MKIGYVKDNLVGKNTKAYNAKKKEIGVDKIYADRKGESTKLKDMVRYARAGDTIILQDIRDVSGTAGEFIQLLSNVSANGVTVICSKQKVDTSVIMWKFVLDKLKLFDDVENKSDRGRPQHAIDIDEYVDIVERREMTVCEVCEILNIGKSTYYRRYKELKKKEEGQTS